MTNKILKMALESFSFVIAIGVILYFMLAISLFSYLTALEIINLNYKYYLVSVYITLAMLGFARNLRYNIDRIVIAEKSALTFFIILKTILVSFIISTFLGPFEALFLIITGFKESRKESIASLIESANPTKSNCNDN